MEAISNALAFVRPSAGRRRMAAPWWGLVPTLALLAAVADAQPTYSSDIAALVHRHCASCHSAHRSAPFALTSHRDVSKRGRMILDLIERRVMPPWLPAEGPGFASERRLSEAEIDLFRRWVDAGMPVGDATKAPPLPEFRGGFELGEPDLVLAPEEPFLLPADGPEVFRNFVIPVPLERVRFVRALELDPGETKALHHALIQADETHHARRLDALDAEPGFPGMSMGRARPLDGHMIGWTPGKGPRHSGEGMAFRLKPRMDLVLQVHLRPTGREERVRPRIGFYFTDRAPEFFPHSIELYDERIDLPPGRSDLRVTDRVTLAAPCRVLAIYPHAHYLATRLRAHATKPDGERVELFHIPRWDFDWQDEYTYRDPFLLPAGTTIEIDYRYDNTARNPNNPNDPPVRVRFGSRSVDEMGTLTIQVLPLDEAGRQALERGRFLHRLEKNPFDADALNHLGILAARANELEEAIALFRRALRFDPEVADHHANLGRALLDRGEFAAGERSVERALELDPTHVPALLHRAESHERQKRFERALADLERAAELEPTGLLVWNRIGLLHGRAGRTAAARAAFERALSLQPNQPEALCNLGITYLGEGRPSEALPRFRAALQAREDYANARFLLARALLELGRSEEARVELERLVRERPDHRAAREWLEKLR